MDLHDPCQADEVLRMLLMEVQWNIRGFRLSCVHREEPTAGVPAAGSEGVELLVGLVAIAPPRVRAERDVRSWQGQAGVGARTYPFRRGEADPSARGENSGQTPAD